MNVYFVFYAHSSFTFLVNCFSLPSINRRQFFLMCFSLIQCHFPGIITWDSCTPCNSHKNYINKNHYYNYKHC